MIKLLFYTIAIFSIATLAYAARFDFTGGQPTVMDDGEVGDTYQQTRYDFVNGVPRPVLDQTATQAAVGAVPDAGIFWLD